MRRSPSATANQELLEEKPAAGEDNRGWLEGQADGIILLGGTSLADFRIRYAQSVLRGDLAPSLWSRCGILLAGDVFASVPLDIPDASAVPPRNGVRHCRLNDFVDAKRFPNLAVIRFAKAHDNALRDIERVCGDRSLIDLPALMLPWLGYVWGTAGAANPLSNGIGLPAAAFVETVFAMAGFDLTPGLSSASSCPEAIWQSAKWWAHYYKDAAREREDAISRSGTGGAAKEAPSAAAAAADAPIVPRENLGAAVPMVPTGFFIIRQPSANMPTEPAAGDPEDAGVEPEK
jgi:hypothetical protein